MDLVGSRYGLGSFVEQTTPYNLLLKVAMGEVGHMDVGANLNPLGNFIELGQKSS